MAEIMTTLSLLLNVAVLVPVGWGMIARAHWADRAYGSASPARGILLSVYGAILVLSVLLLLHPLPMAAATLFAMQLAYKVTTPFTAGWKNPVALSNLAIAAFHLATLCVLLPRLTP